MVRKQRRQSGHIQESLPPPGRSRGRSYLLASCLVTAGLLLTGGGWLFADWWICLPDDARSVYVGRASCVECHATEVQQWTGSDHDRAMDEATEATVLGDFQDVEFTHHGVTSRMYRSGSKFMVRTEGPDGEMADFQVKYVLGIRPLQNYMVEFDRPADMPAHEIARLQVLRITWDTVKKEWFYLPPPDVSEKLDPRDPLHWTGIAQCWNNMCAYCHSTDLQKNFDVDTLTYHTTFSEIDVSCEACHGPASVHVELARSKSLFWDRKRGYGLAQLKTMDTRPQIESCAPCHSRRSMQAPNFQPGDHYYDHFNNELLAEATYYADGQILDEDYVYGSFIQSKMYHKDIRCTDCHNPHTARLKQDGNKVCTSCHQHPAAKYDTPAHHFHQSDSTGALCVECHMPETTYMEVDPRRDHSIRLPRPDVSLELGTPNACTRCHLTDAKITDEKRATLSQYGDWLAAARAGDEEIRGELTRLDTWMLDSMRQWYKKDSWGDSFARALHAGRSGQPDAEDLLAEVAQDRKLPGIVRASAIQQRGMLPSVRSFLPETKALQDEDPQVRVAAVARFFDRIPALPSEYLDPRQQRQMSEGLMSTVRPLVPLLDDPRRVVRAEVGRVLARLPSPLAGSMLNGAQREKLDAAIQEYIAGVLESNDRGGAHLELGLLHETMNNAGKAEEAYRNAIRVEPQLSGPRSNLAALLDSYGESPRVRRSGADFKPQAWGQEAATLRREELALLARDVGLLPDNAQLQYRYGLSLYLHERLEEAEQALRRACELSPNNGHFLYTLALFYDNYQRYDAALDCLDRLVTLQPGVEQYEQLRRQTREKRGGQGANETK